MTLSASQSPEALHTEKYDISLGYGSANQAAKLGLPYRKPKEGQECDIADLIGHHCLSKGIDYIGLEIGLESYLPKSLPTHPPAHAQMLDQIDQIVELPEPLQEKRREAEATSAGFVGAVENSIRQNDQLRENVELAESRRRKKQEEQDQDPVMPTDPPIPADQSFLEDVLKGLDADDDGPGAGDDEPEADDQDAA